ncbi:hypothetical protein [uncultured Pontibacter sp.]|uniref:hypothetical protein n=1 Tax=uncultured Pontibacter sp. TaxID=453356 RepID=UPI00261DD3E5|nr:hypothetical protein [uncultured Pontibacter sp.]
MNADKNKDQNRDQNKSKINEGNKVPNIHPTAKKDPSEQIPRSEESDQAGRAMGNEPRSGGRQGGKSVEDGGQDVGSSAGSR